MNDQAADDDRAGEATLRGGLAWHSGTQARASGPPAAEDVMHGYTHDKDAYIKRLRRIEGQVRGLQRMVEQDKYCIDILTQVSAATKALQSVALGLLEEHLGHCVVQAVSEGGDTASEKISEASDAIARLVRS
jgi:CsoR family transcriptional regulator, copper-sensing transcriptional repressor